MAGLTESGFEIKTEEDVLADVRSEIDANFGALNASKLDTGPLATIVHLIAKIAASLWLLGLTVWNSQSPSGAFGVLLDRVLELTGVLRLLSAVSTVDGVAVGTNATVLAVGRRIKNTVTGTYWASTSAKTITTLSAWGASTAYVKGDLRTNDSGKIYYCTIAGTSAGSGGPTGTGTAITDGTVTWRYIAAGTAAVVVPFASELTGPIVGAAGNLSSIETPQGGWTSVVNPLDASLGNDTETDAAVRARRVTLLRSTGNAAVDAIIADVTDVDGVDRCYVFKNDTDVTDADGVPPHSVEVLVRGGDDDDVAAALLGTAAAGIRTHGTTTVVVVDSQGISQTIKFTRPTTVNIYIDVDIVIDSATFPSDGDAQIKQALVNFSEGLEVGGYSFGYGYLDVGSDVIRNDLFAPVKQVSGVTKVSTIEIGTAPSPSGTTDITITGRQVADFDTSRITVTHV